MKDIEMDNLVLRTGKNTDERLYAAVSIVSSYVSLPTHNTDDGVILFWNTNKSEKNNTCYSSYNVQAHAVF